MMRHNFSNKRNKSGRTLHYQNFRTIFFFFNFHLSKLHLIHPLASVPMQEGFTFKHSGELLTDPFK